MGMLDELDIMRGSRYERSGWMEDLEEAIERAEDAVQVTPRTFSNLSRQPRHLSESTASQHKPSPDLEVLHGNSLRPVIFGFCGSLSQAYKAVVGR